MNGFVVWFTGLSGAGKSTLAAMLTAELRARGVHVELLDGDEVRTHLSKGLGFSREDRDINIRRIGFVAKLVARAGASAITAAISPYRAVRDELRAQIPRFVEVYVECAIPSLAERDPKGLYKKALAGEIKHFTGIDDPYEPPLAPEVTVQTDRETREESLAKIVGKLEEMGFLPARAGLAEGARKAGPRLLAPHGGELFPRLVTGERREAMAERARGRLAIDLDAEAERWLDLLATGALSPLKGFLGSKDHLRVAREGRLENGLPWPVPVLLGVREDVAAEVRIGAEVALRGRDGRLVGLLEVADLHRPDADRGPICVGGEVFVLERPSAPALAAEAHDPATTRALFTSRGYEKVVGCRTTALPLGAMEHVLKAALETADGLFVQALTGPDEGDAVPARVRGEAWEALCTKYFPFERVLLSAQAIPARPTGGRSAVLDAIVCQNHGCSHVVLPTAEAPGAAEALGVYAPSEIGITPLCFDDVFYSETAGSLATVKTAPRGDRRTLDEPSLRAALMRGETPPSPLVRPEVAAILGAHWTSSGR
jgi:sulfate adenylyltransferase/3'-phosphoadenosine 5'-phosphosulfate synthase